MKIHSVIALTCLLYLLSPAGYLAAAFSDIEPDYAYKNAVEYTQEKGIFKGYEDETFRPFQPINRAEFTKIIMVFSNKFDPTNDCQLSKDLYDVSPDQWFYPYICQAVNQGIIDGYPNGFFLPGNFIQTAEVSKIMALSLGAEKIAMEPWYEPYVRYLEDRNALPGDVSHLTQELHRGQIAEIIHRLDTGYYGLNKSAFYSEPIEEEPTLSHETITEGVLNFIRSEGIFQETLEVSFYEEEVLDYDQESLYERRANFHTTTKEQAFYQRSARLFYGDPIHYKIDVTDTARPPKLNQTLFFRGLLSRYGDLDLITIQNDRWYGLSAEMIDQSIHFKNYLPNSIIGYLRSNLDTNLSIKQLKAALPLYEKDPFIRLNTNQAKKDVHLSSLNEQDFYAVPFTLNTQKLITLLKNSTRQLSDIEKDKTLSFFGGSEDCPEFECIVQVNGKLFVDATGEMRHYQTELYLDNNNAAIFNNALYRHSHESMEGAVYNRPDNSTYLTVDFDNISTPEAEPVE